MYTVWHPTSTLLKLAFLSVFLVWFPIQVFGQPQIGSDIDGEFPYDHLGLGLALNETGNIMAVGIPHIVCGVNLLAVYAFIN
ncbi:MAG: hypothetical protein WBA61_16475 [Aequorivita sp.]